jgi:hypothetical protein
MSRSLPRRMLRAALLESALYEEVEAERRSIGQALIVVLLASGGGALGAWLGAYPPLHVAIDALAPIVFWLGASLFAYMAGATFFRGPHTQTDFAEVLRTTGFAFAPGLLNVVLGALPAIHAAGQLIPPSVLADAWVVAASIVAVRQALDFGTLRAIGTYGVAYVLLWLVLAGALISLPF